VAARMSQLKKRGIGYYSYDQIKNETTAGRLGAIVIGSAWIFGGLFVIVRLINVRRAEFHVWGAADSHVIGFIFGACLIGIGAFAMHVGLIHYSRKLYQWASRRSRGAKQRAALDSEPKG
jgi:hypothetical protein